MRRGCRTHSTASATRQRRPTPPGGGRKRCTRCPRPMESRCLCGGTGMYFHALTHGLAPVPEVPEEARAEARSLLASEGAQALHARLFAADPNTAASLRPSDAQRVARAWEVWRGTGRGLAEWQKEPPVGPFVPRRFLAILIDPPRDSLRAAIRLRWADALRDGAIEEVRALLERGLNPALPAMRAHGVPELRDALQGRHIPGGSRRAGMCRDRPIHQASGNLVPAPSAAAAQQRGQGSPDPDAYDHCAFWP